MRERGTLRRVRTYRWLVELVVALMLLIVGSAYFLRGPGSARASHSSAPAGKRSLSRYARLVRGIPYLGPPAKPALVPLLSTGSVEVVGESYYQPALRAAARGRSGWEAPPVAAVLVPEPRNPHDEHAVRVDVNGRTVGYLPRGIAPPYQRELLKLDGRGVAGSCPARVTGGGEGYFYGICLDLAPAETCVPMNLPEGLYLLEARASVTVTGE